MNDFSRGHLIRFAYSQKRFLLVISIHKNKLLFKSKAELILPGNLKID